MAKIEFTEVQEKALIKYLAGRFVCRSCLSCKHERGSTEPLSKICSGCKNYSRWEPNKHRVKVAKQLVEEIKMNK